ncbi:MAG: Asparaginase/glutaminase [Firmicutes bacterium]|nr:Asparaginase/glutaminase [Bacillota bacterium]
MKKIIIIFTGGTISMKKDEESDAAVPALGAEGILKLSPGIESLADISFFDFGMLPSPHITPQKMMELSKLITEKVETGGYDGVVVTHGTDSLEETAYLVDLTYKGSKPVVFTGSMKSSSDFGWDGPSNLTDSVLTAISEDGSDRGVMVVLDGEIHAAAQVTKTSTHSLSTFKSVDFGPLGFVEGGKAFFFYRYERRQHIPAEKIEDDVALIKCGCGMDDRLLRFCADSGCRGIVIEGMGRGNIPPGMVPGVEHALSRSIPVVLVSRCPTGKVLDDYGYKGAGRELKDMGVILGGNLPGQKARIKLMAALAYTSETGMIKEIFEKDYYR